MRLQTKVRRVSRDFLTEQFTRALMQSIAEGLKAEAIKPALELTSGRVTKKQLAEAGHPFARSNRTAAGRLKRGATREVRAARKSLGRIAKLPINKHSGALQRSLHIRVRSGGGTWKLYSYSNHPHAVVLSPDGTPTMVPRGFVEALSKRLSSQRLVSRLRGIIRRTRLR